MKDWHFYGLIFHGWLFVTIFTEDRFYLFITIIWLIATLIMQITEYLESKRKLVT